MKPVTDPLEKTNVIYNFDCDCGLSYIGETKRSLGTRINEHNTRSRDSSINDHIQICPEYKSALRKFTREQPLHCPSNRIKKDFLITHFEILEKNLFSTNERKTNEAVHIILNAPALNKQVFHRKTVFLCPCPTSKPDGAFSGQNS